MHRVELVLEIDNALAPDVVSKIRDQKDIGVSMGCKIKHDVCSICGNREAANRNQYCKHLKYQLGEIYKDGRVVCAYNPNPKFFDISVVWRPADRTGYMLKKVARLGSGLDTEFSGVSGAALGENTAALTTLAQALSKSADREKKVEGVGTDAENLDSEDAEKDLHSKWLKVVAPKALADYKKISSEDIKDLAKYELPEVLATLTDHGIILTTPEFLDLVFEKMTGGPAPKGMAEKLVKHQSELFNKLSNRPDLVASVIKSGAVAIPGVTPVNAAVSNKIAKYDSSRSLKEAWITKRAFNMPGHVTYTDPGTGAKYVSTAEELTRAKAYDQKGEAASLVGAAAMGLITYKALSALLGVKELWEE